MQFDGDPGLFDFADLVFAVGRRISASIDPSVDVCTPVESAVMRFVIRNPGATPGAAAAATSLPSSNLSRVLRSLEEKDLVRLERNGTDARYLSLHPTELARQNLAALSAAWTEVLEGILDPATLELVTAALRLVENGLVERNAVVRRAVRA